MNKIEWTFSKENMAEEAKEFDPKYLLGFVRFFITKEKSDSHCVFGLEENGKLVLFGNFESLNKATKYLEAIRAKVEENRE